jgi:hypothetical protein
MVLCVREAPGAKEGTRRRDEAWTRWKDILKKICSTVLPLDSITLSRHNC